MKVINNLRAEVAHFLRANVESARKPGSWLNKLCETISPRTTFFHRSEEASISDTPLKSRKVSVPNSEAKGSYSLSAILQTPLNHAKMAKARQWAEGQIKDRTDLKTNHIVTESLKQIEKENPEKALALYERAMVVADNPDTVKMEVDKFLSQQQPRKSHTELDINDALCALELAHSRVTKEQDYPQVEFLTEDKDVEEADTPTSAESTPSTPSSPVPNFSESSLSRPENLTDRGTRAENNDYSNPRNSQ